MEFVVKYYNKKQEPREKKTKSYMDAQSIKKELIKKYDYVWIIQK